MAKKNTTAALSALPPDTKPQVSTTKAGRAGQKVTVACKMPNGIILRGFDWNTEDVPVFGGGVKQQKVARPNGTQALINGARFPFGEAPAYAIVGGYALTPNVDAELWDLWFEQNKNSDLVKNKQIFAYEKPEMATDAAKEHKAVRSGLEPINPGVTKDAKGKERPADSRMPRGTPQITGAVTESLATE
jgi:hypothetical protein